MSPRRTSTDLVRVIVATVVSFAVGAAALAGLILADALDPADTARLLILGYIIIWPVYVLIYVWWGAAVYRRMGPRTITRVTHDEDDGVQGLIPRLLGLTGATNTTLSAAIVAVVLTIVIAQQVDFRTEPVYIGLALLTVASSWVLMVFSFAQSYFRLAGGTANGTHFRFRFDETADFGDYMTLTIMLSAMAATTPAEVVSKRAWRLVRTNVIVAFVFNSVIIAMMVSLLFGGLLA